AGPVAAAQPCGRAAGELEVAPARHDPGEPAQQRRLAGPVGPDDRERAALGDREPDPVEEPLAGDLDDDVVAADHPSTPRREVRSTRMKNGAPKNAVTTPIGISAGAATVRARRSAAHRNAPPNSSDSGSSDRWLGPTSSRTVCGTMIPTNPISPDTLTAAAVPRDAAAITSSRVRCVCSPSVAASSSPTA